ncbi:hypothetical protein OQA88_6220 [Cercophora sp. LCS_1]
MAIEQEATFVADGKSLYTKSWLPDGATKATLVFVHGYSDHVNRYNPFFNWLAARGIAVHGFDQRGWGRSVTKPAEKGLTGPTSRVLADIAAFIELHLPKSSTDPPIFVMGHSMGGGEVLTFLSDDTYQKDVVCHVRGWLLEAPFIGFPPEAAPSALKIFGARLVGRLLPHRQMLNKLPPEDLTRDPAIVKSITEDKLMHDTGTLEGLAGLLDRTTALESGSVRPEGDAVKSLWIGHGTKDKATSYHASKKYFEQFLGAVADKSFKSYEGWYHQLHNDGPETEEFFQDVSDWILKRVGEEAGRTEAKL